MPRSPFALLPHVPPALHILVHFVLRSLFILMRHSLDHSRVSLDSSMTCPCFTYSYAIYVLFPTCSRDSRALWLALSSTSRILSHVCSRTPIPSVSCVLRLVWPHFLWALLPYARLVSRFWYNLCPNIIFCALELTCLKLLFFSSFRT